MLHAVSHALSVRGLAQGAEALSESSDESEDDILGKPKNWAAKGEVDDPELSGDTKLTPENFQEMTLKAF